MTNPDKSGSRSALKGQLDLITTVVPFVCILLLCIVFMAAPESSGSVLAAIRFFLGDELGSYYLIIGLGMFLCSLYIAFSKYGTIRLGSLSRLPT